MKMQPSNSAVMHGTLNSLVGMFLLITAAGVQASTTHDVSITFRNGCPVDAQPALAEISKGNGDRVRWTSDSGDQYEIFFDPFKGQPLRSDTNGVLRSPALDASIPVNVEFKYTIVGLSCQGVPYDPRIKVY